MSRKFYSVAVMAVYAMFATCAVALSPTTDANITGHVVDIETGEHLPYYVIKLVGTPVGTLTDGSGHYAIRDLTPGHYIVEASFTGYKTITKDVDIKNGQTVEVNFDVEPDAFMLDQVVVTGSKSEQTRLNSPSLVNVLSAKTFNLVNACSLADGLNFQPGVRV